MAMTNPRGPLTLAQIQALLTLNLADLRPWELCAVVDALSRRPFPQGNPGVDPSSQPTMGDIVAGWNH